MNDTNAVREWDEVRDKLIIKLASKKDKSIARVFIVEDKNLDDDHRGGGGGGGDGNRTNGKCMQSKDVKRN